VIDKVDMLSKLRVPKVLRSFSGSKWVICDYEPEERASLAYKMEDSRGAMMIEPSAVELEFSRVGRNPPDTKITVQGRYECAAASLAMLLDEKLFFVKRAMGKVGWRNDDSGAGDEVMIQAARLLGRDLISLNRKDIKEGIGPCTVTVPSLNIPGMSHSVTWNGEEILDPNWGRPGRKFWGTEWAPWTMKPQGALYLLNRVLSESERKQVDEITKSKNEAEIHALKLEVLAAMKGASK
jgi:hypothetical protein